MEMKIKLNLNNAAFGEIPGLASGTEIARILKRLANMLDGTDVSESSNNLCDVNGNTVGKWKVK